MKAYIDPGLCFGCTECILACPQQAIQIQWNVSVPIFMTKMIEYAAAVLCEKLGRVMFMTFVTNVTPLCDCTPFSDRPIVPDLAILASVDPVTIDQAAADLANNAPGNPISCPKTAVACGADKLRALYPNIDWAHQFEYAEEMGLGRRRV